ncbi:L-type lectin-domain containing receptor kinase S.4-like [Lotus japonicus]|uniref:L-type lectin-domain containing receptor kinase S.4-like n=1 Tax=Lotus japonicus TaxID=34305 RepID=UPI00258BF090|nr:L-type lectin-domain containing receptor kinase S.4-like [Lotus japonicus]
MAKKVLVLVCFAILLLSIRVKSRMHDDDDDEELFFDGFSAASSNMSVNGCASIESNGLLRLTNDTQGLMGDAFYSTPIKLKNSTTGKAFSFSTAFAFAIFNWYGKPPYHGFAFSVSPSKALPSQHIMSLISPNFTLDREFVYDPLQEVVRRMNDGNFFIAVFNSQHYFIDLNNLNPKKDHLDPTEGVVIQAWVDYDSINNQLEIRLSPNSSKPTSPILSWNNVDFSPILNDTMYVGFSASTSVLANRQYILGWSFKVNGEAISLDLETLPSLSPVLNQVDADSYRQVYFMLKMFLAAAAAAFAICSVLAYLVVLAFTNINNRRLKWKRLNEP